MQIADRTFPFSRTVGGREANLAQPAPAMAVQIQEASHVDGPHKPAAIIGCQATFCSSGPPALSARLASETLHQSHICCRIASSKQRGFVVSAAQSSSKFDYDLLIIGAGVGGHGAALHAIESVSPCPWITSVFGTSYAASA